MGSASCVRPHARRHRAAFVDRPLAGPILINGRLAPGVSLSQARAELATISARLQAAHPDTNRRTTVAVVPYSMTACGDSLSSRRGRRLVCCASTDITGHAFHSRRPRNHGHPEPHRPRTADSLERLGPPHTLCRQNRCSCTGPLRRPKVSDDWSQAESHHLRQRRKRLRSDCRVCVCVVIRTVVRILAKHTSSGAGARTLCAPRHSRCVRPYAAPVPARSQVRDARAEHRCDRS